MRYTVPLAVAVLALTAGATEAQEEILVQGEIGATPTEPPIIIDSEKQESDLRSGVTRFSGNVTIRRGAMHVQAEHGTVTQEDGRITVVELEGQPTTWNDRLDDGTLVEGRARNIHYDVIDNVITLTGDAQIRHEQGEFTGDELVYDLDTERMAGRGSQDSRARVVIEGETVRRGARERDDSEGESNGTESPPDESTDAAESPESAESADSGDDNDGDGDAEVTGAGVDGEDNAPSDEPEDNGDGPPGSAPETGPETGTENEPVGR